MSTRPLDDGAPALVSVRGLRTHFPVGGGLLARARGKQQVVHALDGVTVDIRARETLAVIGESGSGKSTMGRSILRLEEPTSGTVAFRGKDVTSLSREDLRQQRQHMQMVFQNPYSSVNRRNRLIDIISEPLRVHGIGDAASRRARSLELLELVGLNPDFLHRYPHEVSGGQLQRVGIARALATGPEFLVADEPTASLDVSVRAQVMNLLKDLKEELGLTLMFISHDLAVVSYIADHIAVMYLGRIVEVGTKQQLESEPQHPYTRALFAAAPKPDPRQRKKEAVPLGEVPSAIDRPAGCHYQPRCPLAMDICAVEYPPLELKAHGQQAACHAVPSAPLPAGVTALPLTTA
ncbi:ATP-binding cassette domain-containing protein [Nocardioides sp. dk4132]|uniref:ABC transporter ATP-binding protein n=1 Tax=unclassified Nocardioides TaxID=2615069 RepID=UPI001295B7C6|nr:MULTISPECIES: ABC transporter ATP-binding protein [unclassified Nocardioides]MQW76818.1 ATP-binding cassette domain-containing protein [Nocardioides sp. dk4132]QGA06832.1 ATP-binding cassette domain-containing protein [Nocardioides sp. dk884]